MPVTKCPITECNFETDDVNPAVVAALLTIHATTHTATSARIEKVRRPSLSSAGTSEEWSYFLTRWTEYKLATKLGDRDIVFQLLECCDEPLRKDLSRKSGNLTTRTETEVLEAIRKLAVREENTMVARVRLADMRQDHDEPVRNFGARLRGQACICKFFLKCQNCATDVNYTEEILCDVLARGIFDSDIQLDLLGQVLLVLTS